RLARGAARAGRPLHGLRRLSAAPAAPPYERQEPEQRQPRSRRTERGGASTARTTPAAPTAAPPPISPTGRGHGADSGVEDGPAVRDAPADVLEEGHGEIERVGEVGIDVWLHQEIRERRDIPVGDRGTGDERRRRVEERSRGLICSRESEC